MKNELRMFLAMLMLAGCGAGGNAPEAEPKTATPGVTTPPAPGGQCPERTPQCLLPK